MKNAEYWRQRFEAVQDLLLKRGESVLPDVERAYEQAQAELERDIERWYARFARNNRISLIEAKRLLNSRELKELRWTVEEYIRRGGENGVDGRWTKQLENASARVHLSRLDSLKLQLQQQAEKLFGNQVDTLDRLARDIYEDGYYRTAFEIQRGTGVGFSLHRFDETELQKVTAKPWTTDLHTFRDRCWTNKQALVNTVHTQLTRDIITGAGPEKSIRAIQEQFGVAKNKAARLVMTESAFFSAQSQKDCFEELNVERYEILGTLDGHTCAECGDLDGKVFRQKDYQPGVTAPPFHPWCRCTTIPYFDDDEELGLTGERAARGTDGKTHDVPGNMKYTEWRKRYVDISEEEALKIKRKQNVDADRALWLSFLQTTGEKYAMSLEKFQIIKYTDVDDWGRMMEQKRLFEKIDSTDTYSAEYRNKMKEAHTFFQDNGFTFREHALNRFLGQKSGKGKFSFTQDDLLDVLGKDCNYKQADGKEIRFYNSIAVVSAADTKEILSIVVKDKPRKDWMAL